MIMFNILERQRILVDEARLSLPPLQLKFIVHLAALALLFFAVAALGYAVNGYQFAFSFINHQSAAIPEWLLHNLTVFGDGAFVLALVLLFANTRVQVHWVVFWTAILGAIVSNGLKELFDAPRPPAVLSHDAFNLFGKAYKHYSFPSGHTLTGFLLATIGYYYSPKLWQKLGILLIGVLVGLSRVWLGVHWPIDALVGAGLGLLVGCAALWIGHRWQSGINPVMHRVILFLLVIAALLLLVQKNDYRLALPLLYVTAILGLWKTLRNYLLPIPDKSLEPITENKIKIPLFNRLAKSEWLFGIFLVVITLYRILVILQPHLSLFYDEAYYYHWSLNPDFGYYSKPPMVAWCIMLSTALFGDGVVAIKLMASLLYGATSVVLFQIARRYGNATQGLLAGTVFLCIPMIGFNSEFITTDAPLLFFWALALYFALAALEHNRLQSWLWLGVCTGLGMLSKYTMGAFPLAVFAFMLFETKQRQRLLSPGPWLAALVAGLIFGLNIYWNFQHNWIAAQHTQEISQTSGKLFNFGSLLEFLASQFLIFGPVSSWILVSSVYKRRSKPATVPEPFDGFYRLLLWVTGVILFAIGTQAFLSRAFPNWAGPWMIGGTLLMVFGWQAAYDKAQLYKRLSYGFAFNLILLSMVHHWPQLLQWMDITPTAKNDPYHRVAGWPELGAESRAFLDKYPNAKLASDSRDLLAYIGYYGRTGSYDFARWNPNANNVRDYYDLTVNFRNWTGDANQSYVFVSKAPLGTEITAHFNQAETLGSVSTQVYANETMKLYFTLLQGFNGYE